MAHRKISACWTLVLLLAFCNSFAQNRTSSFQEFDKRLQEEPGGFAGNKEALSKVFNAERIRLGEQFESQLLSYLGKDVEKHYWISFFLEAPSYLHGNPRLPYFSLVLKQQALALLAGKSDPDSVDYILRLSVTSAVLSEELELTFLARSYKQRVETLLASDPTISSSFPGMDAYDRCLYDSITSGQRSKCKDQTKLDHYRSPCTIRGGIVDAKALSKPEAVYPTEARAKRISGALKVEVLINESGLVEKILASGNGHPLLVEAANSAALQARFSPTRLSGKPVKVCGVLTYSFKP